MAITFPVLGLKGQIDFCADDAKKIINENFELIEFSKAFGVDRVSTLPASGSTGDQVILDSDNNIYYWTDSWQELEAKAGMIAYDNTNDTAIIFNGSEWVGLGSLVSAENLGTGSEIFSNVTQDGTLQFRTIESGTNISITTNSDSLILDAAGAGGNSKTIVQSDNYEIAASDSDIFLDGVDGWEIVAPNANNFDGRRIRFYVKEWGANPFFDIVDGANNLLFRITEHELKEQSFSGSGNVGSLSEYVEIISFGFDSFINFWSISSLPLFRSKIPESGGGIDVNIDGAAPDEIFRFVVGGTELYSKANVSTNLVFSQPLGSNVFRFKFQRSFAPFSSWTDIGHVFEYSGSGMSGTMKSTINLDTDVEMSFGNQPEEMVVRLVGWRPAGVDNGVIEEVSPYLKRIKINKEL